MWLQGCRGGGGDDGQVSGTVQSGVNVYLGEYSGNQIASNNLPPVQDNNQMKMSSVMAFSATGAMSDLSQSLGVDVSGLDNAFSGSIGLQNTREALDSSSTMRFTGEIFVTIVEKTSSISPEKMSLTPALALDLKSLPNSTRADNNTLQHFVTFFNIHGSHFLSKVYLGGKLHLKFSAAVEKSQCTQAFKSSFEIGAKGTFQRIVKLPADIGGTVTATTIDEKTFETYSSYSQEDLTTIGGNPTKLIWSDWKDTVKDNMAPVLHEYSGMELILRAMQSTEGWTDVELQSRLQAFNNALQAVLSACPGQTTSQGKASAACSGHGLCNFAGRNCSCDEGYAGQDCSTKLCIPGTGGFPGSCGEHGSCDAKGQCTCDPGWTNQDPADPQSPCTQRTCPTGQNMCHDECISDQWDCCAAGGTCSTGSHCCGDAPGQCCDYCASSGAFCPADSPQCCDATCGPGHTSPGLCCDSAHHCSQWPLCHCAFLEDAKTSRAAPINV